MVDLARVVTELIGRGVRVERTSERLSSEPAGEDALAVFRPHPLGAVAQLERSLVRARQREGTALVEDRGVHRRRARRLDEAAVAEARGRAAAGVPQVGIARDPGCSRRISRGGLRAVPHSAGG